MLCPLPSLPLREHKSAQYIQLALQTKAQELSFTHQHNTSLHTPIINLKVIDFLNRKTLKKSHFVTLNLNKCNLNDEGLTLLARGNWRSLKNLSLYSNHLSSLSFGPLSRASWKSLHQIDLSGNNFGNQKGEEMKDCCWQYLTKLDLSCNFARLVFIAQPTGNFWRGLKQVNVSSNRLNNWSLVHLISFYWIELESLNLQRNLLTDDGMKVLARGRWKHLTNLQLSHNSLGVQALQNMSVNCWGKQLRLEMICNQDAYGNLLPFSSMIGSNLSKCRPLLRFPQANLTVIFIKVPTKALLPQHLASLFAQRCIKVVI